MQVGLNSHDIHDMTCLVIMYLLFQNYVHGIDPSPHFRLLGTHYPWLSMPTIRI